MAKSDNLGEILSAGPADPREPIAMPPWLFYPMTLGTLIGGFLLFRRGDIVAATSLGVIAIAGFSGFRIGLSKMLASLIALLAAIWFAPMLGLRYELPFSQQFGTTGLTNRFLCIAAVGVLISLGMTLLLTWISGRFLSRARSRRSADSFLGLGAGLLEGTALVFLFLGGLISLQTWQRDVDTSQNGVAMTVDDWASKTRQSLIGPTIRDHNPFDRIALLAGVREFYEAARVCTDPGAMDRLLDHPKIAGLADDPGFSEAVQAIRRDPAMQKWVDEGKPLDRKTLLEISSNPRLIEIMDHPGFQQAAREAIADLN